MFLAISGAFAARVGGAAIGPGTMRVTFWGALAMAITAGVGALFGTVVLRRTNSDSVMLSAGRPGCASESRAFCGHASKSFSPSP